MNLDEGNINTAVGNRPIAYTTICRIGKDYDRKGDRMSKNNEKLPYLH